MWQTAFSSPTVAVVAPPPLLPFVAERPAVDLPLQREAAQPFPAGPGVADHGEALGAVAAGPPAAGGVLDPGVEDVAPAGQAQGDRAGRPPLVDGPGVEEADQDVK